jgi:hypothetical protein
MSKEKKVKVRRSGDKVRKGKTKSGNFPRHKVVEMYSDTDSSDSDASSIEILKGRDDDSSGDDERMVKQRRVVSEDSREETSKYLELKQMYERRSKIAQLRIEILKREVELLRRMLRRNQVKTLGGKRNLLIKVKNEGRSEWKKN